MRKLTLLTCVLVLSLASMALVAKAKRAAVKTELLSSHETEAVFVGIDYRVCRGLTGRCPERCGSSGEYARFTIEKYLKYEKPGKYGDAKAKDRLIHISDFHKKPTGDPKLNTIIKGLTKGDRVLLSWNHNYVTEGGSSAPQRPITKLEKIAKGKDPKPTAPAQDITSFAIKTGEIHKDVPGCNLSDWRYIFAAVRGGTRPTIKHFKSRKELVEYSDKQFAIKPRPKSDDVSKLIADRVEKKMNFAKNDLVIVNLHTGGPPFGKFRQELKDGKLRFWMEEPNVRMRGMALQMVFKFYRIPKGLKVEEIPPATKRDDKEPPRKKPPPAKTNIPPIKKIAKVLPLRSVFQRGASQKPIVIKSAEDAAKHFDGKNLAAIQKQVDFKQQFVLIFAWRGSGGDRLNYAVLESYPEQIVFKLKRGRTRDLRSHLHVYALRSNVTWKR